MDKDGWLPWAHHAAAYRQHVFPRGEPSPWDADTALELENKAKTNLSLWLVLLLVPKGLRSAKKGNPFYYVFLSSVRQLNHIC